MNRVLRVCRSGEGSDVRLRGKYVRAWGFNPGDYMDVNIEQDKITIIRVCSELLTT